jgi:general secretion pathway protein D
VTEPIIAQKSTEEVVRLREGEANIVSGILNTQDQVSWSGIPGLSAIPILKYLFGSKDHTITNDEVVFLMVPHIVRGNDVTPENMRPIDTGVGQNVELRRIAVNGPGANSPPQLQPVTTHALAPTAANLGTVPGQSAATAAQTAMAQMTATANGQAINVPQPNLGVSQPAPVPAGNAPAPPPAAQPATPGASPGGQGGTVRLLLNAPGQQKNGATFQVPVVIGGATDVAAVPMQIQYDASKLSLVNVGPGDFLSRDGQSVAESHRDDGPGNVTLNVSRPRGASGMSGAGVVCVLTFQAKDTGDTTLSITRAGATSGSGQAQTVQGSQISVNIQ